MVDFVHLHVHSEYSLLDGYASTQNIVARAAELGMDSIALTDHGVLYGAMEFYTNAKKAGIKPIIGVEAYMAPESRRDAHRRGAKNSYHLLLLAKNEIGYRNLVRLTTRAHLEGMGKGVFARPRIDRELLEQYHEGLIVTSACLAGDVIQHLIAGERDRARATAAWYRDLLGPDRYFLELQLHDNAPELESINDELVRIGKELGIPLVVTNDTHFVYPDDLEAHTMILALGSNMTFKEVCAKKYQMDATYYLMSGETMWQRFKRYGTAPFEHTRRIADQCTLALEFGRVQLPTIDIPEGHDAVSYLRLVCEEGLMRRFNGNPPDIYVRRLDYELDVINQTGFPDYMLIVWDYVKFARARGIPCVPRGSAGASLVLYCLGITDVDPVQNNLLFERFLSRERLEMPDIDIDFADSRRHEVLEYITARYGREKTAQIITYGTLGAKAAIRDMGRVLGLSSSTVDRVARLVPALPVGITIAQAIERVPELANLATTNSDVDLLLAWAQKVEGRIKSVGTHACGVVVSRTPLEDIVPLQRTTKDENALMAAFDGPTLQKMGLLKMDVLGSTTLSIIAETLELIAQTTGRTIDIADIPLDDPKVFEALGRGETSNVFQLESPGMTRYLMQLKPTRIEDLYAMVALYRPGPLEQIPVYIHNKNNPQDITYLHPILKPILEDTYGVIVYQEQIMSLLQEVADYTLGQAYIVIKAISKKDKTLMAENEVRFKQGCLRKGLTQEQADQLWDLILPFAGYSFNRPHSTLYGRVSYQTAWLKVHFPPEYATATLRHAQGDSATIAKTLIDCRRAGIRIHGPDINTSMQQCTCVRDHDAPNGRIMFGLSDIKHVGDDVVHAILSERSAHGPFPSLTAFRHRVPGRTVNKRIIDILIRVGAFDSMYSNRLELLSVLEEKRADERERQREKRTQLAFAWDDTVGDSQTDRSDDAEAVIEQYCAWEKELLGMEITPNPKKRLLLERSFPNRSSFAILAVHEEHDRIVGKSLFWVGMIESVRIYTTKRKQSMAVVTVTDEYDTLVEVVAFPNIYAAYKDVLKRHMLVAFRATVHKRHGGLQLVLESITVIDLQSERRSTDRSQHNEHGGAVDPSHASTNGRTDTTPWWGDFPTDAENGHPIEAIVCATHPQTLSVPPDVSEGLEGDCTTDGRPCRIRGIGTVDPSHASTNGLTSPPPWWGDSPTDAENGHPTEAILCATHSQTLPAIPDVSEGREGDCTTNGYPDKIGENGSSMVLWAAMGPSGRHGDRHGSSHNEDTDETHTTSYPSPPDNAAPHGGGNLPPSPIGQALIVVFQFSDTVSVESASALMHRVAAMLFRSQTNAATGRGWIVIQRPSNRVTLRIRRSLQWSPETKAGIAHILGPQNVVETTETDIATHGVWALVEAHRRTLKR